MHVSTIRRLRQFQGGCINLVIALDDQSGDVFRRTFGDDRKYVRLKTARDVHHIESEWQNPVKLLVEQEFFDGAQFDATPLLIQVVLAVERNDQVGVLRVNRLELPVRTVANDLALMPGIVEDPSLALHSAKGGKQGRGDLLDVVSVFARKCESDGEAAGSGRISRHTMQEFQPFISISFSTASRKEPSS